MNVPEFRILAYTTQQYSIDLYVMQSHTEPVLHCISDITAVYQTRISRTDNTILSVSGE